MARKRYTAEQIIGHLRQAEIWTSEGKTIIEAVRDPYCGSDTPRTESLHNRSISLQDNKLQDPTKGSAKQIRAFPQHEKDTRTHKKCALCVPFSEGEVPEDLAEIARRWEQMPAAIRKGILAMVSEAARD
mgnify:CR=1 FL=1